MSDDSKIIPFPPPERRKPESEVTRKELEDGQYSGDPIKKWIDLADQFLKSK